MLISCVVTAQLICVFVFAYAKSRFSHDVAQFCVKINHFSTDDIGDHLCERVLSVLFELWLLACQKCFPSPSLWKTFRKMCIYWRHHEALVTQWHRINHALTARLLKFMYGPDYPELIISKWCMNCGRDRLFEPSIKSPVFEGFDQV